MPLYEHPDGGKLLLAPSGDLAVDTACCCGVLCLGCEGNQCDLIMQSPNTVQATFTGITKTGFTSFNSTTVELSQAVSLSNVCTCLRESEYIFGGFAGCAYNFESSPYKISFSMCCEVISGNCCIGGVLVLHRATSGDSGDRLTFRKTPICFNAGGADSLNLSDILPVTLDEARDGAWPVGCSDGDPDDGEVTIDV